MTTKVNFSDAEPFTRWMVVDEATITGNKINLKLQETDFWDVDTVIDTVHRNDEFTIADIDFQKEVITIEVDK